MTGHNEQQRQHLIYKNAILYFLYETFGGGAGSIELDDVEYDPAIKDFHYPPFMALFHLRVGEYFHAAK